MKTQLNMDKIAAALGAERREGLRDLGYFGAMQLRADIEGRFRVPAGGGGADRPAVDAAAAPSARPSNARAAEAITARVREHEGVNVEPMQLAAMLLRRPPNRSARIKLRKSCAAADARADEPRVRR